jgi:hypothetical protein
MTIALVLVGCTGDRGPAGPAGADGTNGMDGMNGSNGNDIILSARAKLGLDIAPVMLDLTGLDGPGIEKVGIGSYWVNAVIDCSGCHNSPTGGYLAGGVPFVIDASGDVVYSRNLTPDPMYGLKHTEAQFIETFQTGRDFHPDQNGGDGMLIVMPWSNFRWLHVDDIKAIYAYLRAIPANTNSVSTDQKGPAAAATPIPLPPAYDRGQQTRTITPDADAMGTPIPDPDGVIRGIEVSPLADPTNFDTMDAATQARFGRGAYLVDAAVCSDCHTNPPYSLMPGPSFLAVTPADYLKGGGVFVTPPGLESIFHQQRSMSHNLLGKLNGFFNETGMNFNLFHEIIATGTHVDDTPAAPLAWPMPFDHFRNMETEDLVSLYTYLSTLAKNEGTTPAANDKLTQGAAIWCDATHACPSGAGYTCHINATFGNECVGNSCADSSECGACQHCDATSHCVAPSTTVAADQACVNGGI